jgi:hypothetical protein
MKIDITQLKNIILQATAFLKKYAVVVFIVIGLSVIGFLVYQVGQLATKEPGDTLVDEKTGETRPIRIDSKAVEQVQKLQSTNVEVKALFNQTRDNPFNE